MKTEIEETKANDRPVVERLLQLYLYDFAEIMGGDVEADGVYHYISLDETWNDPLAHTYLVRVDGMLAGLAIVIERS
ncbi:GNAT family N-acetyltransferase, partial [bacterium]|nr:GNAT family N-acetyltransferase [bacterium]